MDETITINQLAKIFDISHHQIRYYEEKSSYFHPSRIIIGIENILLRKFINLLKY